VFRELSGAVSPVTFSAMSAQMYALKPWRPRVALQLSGFHESAGGDCFRKLRNAVFKLGGVGFRPFGAVKPRAAVSRPVRVAVGGAAPEFPVRAGEIPEALFRESRPVPGIRCECS